MTARKISFITCLILLSSTCSGQILRDTNICITPHQVKVINLAFNELGRLTELNTMKDSLIGTKDGKIEVLKEQVRIRTEQVILLNSEAEQQKKAIKKLKIKVLGWKIATIAGILSTIYIIH